MIERNIAFFAFEMVMGRIIGVDYGMKRTGLAVTDVLQIAVHGLTTVETPLLADFLKEYFQKEQVEKIVFGMPSHKDGNPTHVSARIKTFATELQKQNPTLTIDFEDEQFSSSDAKSIILQSGANKKKRRDKALVDKISAVLILQRYLKHI